MQILGLDMHSGQFVLAHLNARGKLCRMYERPTSGKNLLEVLEKIPGPKRLVVEESHLAQWVKHVAEAHVEELIICDPKRNKWIAQDEYADDQTSARKLAELLRGGFIKAVRHPDDAGAELRSLFLHYYNLARQTARFKNMGNKYHESDQAVYERRSSKTGCRPLKWVVMQHFMAAVYRSKKPNRFKRQFEHLKQSGLGERTARRHVCRTILSTVRAMWIKGQAYRDQA